MKRLAVCLLSITLTLQIAYVLHQQLRVTMVYECPKFN